jgi:hypothetical protein
MRDKPLPDWSIGRFHTEADEKINAEVARDVSRGKLGRCGTGKCEPDPIKSARQKVDFGAPVHRSRTVHGCGFY